MKRLIPLAMIGLLAWGPACADSDHDLARHAREAGRILPLAAILERAGAAYPGRVVEVELEDEGDVLIYELKVLTDDGKVLKLHYDAATGDLLQAKSRGGRR